MAKTSCKKGQYYCNTDKKCKPIPEGYTVREDGFLVKEGWSAKYKKSIDCNNPKGFSQKAHCAGKKKKMTEESNPRIARKKGQPAKSKKHSDLYTDEDPKGTIHGLGFKDVATAKASVAKIRKSGRSHAHKIQAAIAMEQRARVMGKTSEAAVYRKFINSMKKKTKAMNESKHGDHEYEMIRRQTDNIMVAAKKIKKKVGKGEGNEMAWVQSKITKAADYLDTAADYMTDKESVKEGTLRSWFKGSKSKDGKGGWVNVLTGGTCASDEPGEGVPKCVSRAKYERMTPAERRSAARRKKAADPGQQEKTGAAKPTYVSTDKPKKKKKKTMKDETEFTSLPLQLEVPQSDGEFKCGLMFRESLEQDRGMLFIFESNDYWTFHMKNTFIPLDIAFIKEDGTIDSIKELDPMSPIPVYSDSEVRYAVEVNRGWFADNDVNVGDGLLEDIQEHHKKDADGNTIPHEHEEELNEVKDKKGKGSGTKDACYYKVKSRYSVWPSAYASGALVKCRKVGAANWGNSKKEEVEVSGENLIERGISHSMSRQPGGMRKFMADRDKRKEQAKEIMKDRKPAAPAPMSDHYSWRDSFELTENQANRMKLAASRQKQNQGRAAQQFSVLKPKPIQGRVSQSSQNMSGKPKPTPVQTTQTAPEAKTTPQQTQTQTQTQTKTTTPTPKMGRIEKQNRARLGDERVDALKAKNAEFQAAKKSGTLKQFRVNNPKLSGRERAQQMARDRIAAKKLGKPVVPDAKKLGKPVVPQAQQKAAATPSGDKLKAGSFGISAAGKKQAAANRAEVANKKTSGNTSSMNVSATKKMSPEMQKRVAQTQVGKNAAKEIDRINPKPGQTVNTRTNNDGSVSSTVTSNKTIGVDTSPGKSDTKSLVNPNKKQNVKNAKNLKKDFMKVDKEVSSMSIDKEPKAQVDVGKFSGPGGF